MQKRWRKDRFVHEFPCGKVEDHETYEQAAVRELREETGLEAKASGNVMEIRDGGFAMGFVPLYISDNTEPVPTDPGRKQTFLWLLPSEMPLGDFTKTCREYVETL